MNYSVEELGEMILKAEKEILLQRLDAMLDQIKTLALDSISEDMHLVEHMGKVESMDHTKFLESVLEEYLERSE